jgi:hypothetical protein
MRKGETLLIGITSILALGLAIYLVGKTKRERMFERLDKIAEEGYETAADILYPLKGTWSERFWDMNSYS